MSQNQLDKLRKQVAELESELETSQKEVRSLYGEVELAKQELKSYQEMYQQERVDKQVFETENKMFVVKIDELEA